MTTAEKMTTEQLEAFALARRLAYVSPSLATRARDLARVGWSAEEIKGQLKAAMDARYEATREKIIKAEELGNRYLADANEAADAGKTITANRLYEKGQYWLDRANKLRGWGE